MQPKNQVADRRAEPDEERTADSSVVTRDPSDDFVVPLGGPDEEITEQWGLHDWYICRDDQCSVKPARISRDVSQKRGYLRFCSCLKRSFVSACTNSQISTPRECDSHSKVQLFSWVLHKLHGPVVLWNAMERMFDPWWRRWFMMECPMT